MDSEKILLLSHLKFSSIEKINDNFLKAKCYVMALGKNINKSHFSKENVDKAYSTLAYAPVIGHLMVDDNGVYHLGGHDYKLDLKDFTLKSQCVPFGVVLPSESPVYEDVTEASGAVSTYLTCEVVIWISRYPELSDAFYNADIFTNQSMEIFCSKSIPLAEDPTYMDVVDFSFDALCMLGKSDDDKFNVAPCFPSASIVPLAYSINKDEFTIFMNELKEELSLCFNRDTSKKEKGGTNILDKKLEILQKFGKTIEDLDFSIDSLSEEDLSLKMEELFGEKSNYSSDDPSNDVISFSATYNEKRDALRDALKSIVVKDDDGNYVSETGFYLVDFDDTYVYLEKYYWDTNGSDMKYGRRQYSFDEKTNAVTLSDVFEEMVVTWLTLDEKAKLDETRANYEELTKEFNLYKETHSSENSEIDALKSYKAKNEAAVIFSKYEDKIGETVEFKDLKDNIEAYSLDALEKECIYIMGLHASELQFAKTKENTDGIHTLKFSIEPPMDNQKEDTEVYGGLFSKYLKK